MPEPLPAYITEPREFYDLASKRHMAIGRWGGVWWLFYRHPDGQWVSLRQATRDDLWRLGMNETEAASAAAQEATDG